ncbi:MAG: adenine phosphoribosyltransferase [Candidatus Dormibacteraeota bacterium]|uniref:Adenine phosphoribosyltransferase n=1 Tax=Candidatus Dormiibacter inghamiae TaxID=3127013 RepID=A0A934KAD6_9BACT|nr:adenine phosphoribosyltransferase [Candidatus Dormibacteraeota bacterium]MBJ7605908.1 adenine phosphoribosyltransferase [Candidatus Dormibacteraeota bacterium]
MELRDFIREVPDFPQPGILFRDITPLLADPVALRESVEVMSRPWLGQEIDLIAAMEARGFMFGAAMAIRLGAGFVPVRKEGKLPWKTRAISYTLEYRDDILHVHEDAVRAGQRVLVVDDVIATGGTAGAVVELIRQLGGEVVGAQFLVELAGLAGRDHLPALEVRSVIRYEGT